MSYLPENVGRYAPVFDFRNLPTEDFLRRYPNSGPLIPIIRWLAEADHCDWEYARPGKGKPGGMYRARLNAVRPLLNMYGVERVRDLPPHILEIIYRRLGIIPDDRPGYEGNL